MRKFMIFTAKFANVKVRQLKPKVEQQPPKNRYVFENVNVQVLLT